MASTPFLILSGPHDEIPYRDIDFIVHFVPVLIKVIKVGCSKFVWFLI